MKYLVKYLEQQNGWLIDMFQAHIHKLVFHHLSTSSLKIFFVQFGVAFGNITASIDKILILKQQQKDESFKKTKKSGEKEKPYGETQICLQTDSLTADKISFIPNDLIYICIYTACVFVENYTLKATKRKVDGKN